MVFVAVFGAGGSFLKIFIDAFDIVCYVLQCSVFGAFPSALKAVAVMNAITALHWTVEGL